MRYLLIFGLLICSLPGLLAQTVHSGRLVIYPTYNHFERDSGIVHEGNYVNTGSSFLLGSLTCKFKEKKGETSSKRKKLQLPTNDIWGFKWGDALYRISPSGEPMYVFYNGKVVYYEVCAYSISVSTMVTSVHQNPDRDVDVTESILSENLNSTLYAVKYTNTNRRRKANLEGVMMVLKKHTKGEQVFDCLTQGTTYQELRECIQMIDDE